MFSITSAMQGLNILYLDLVIGIGFQGDAVLHLSIEQHQQVSFNSFMI